MAKSQTRNDDSTRSIGDGDDEITTSDCCDDYTVVKTLSEAMKEFDSSLRKEIEAVGYRGSEVVTVCRSCGGPGEVLLH